MAASKAPCSQEVKGYLWKKCRCTGRWGRDQKDAGGWRHAPSPAVWMCLPSTTRSITVTRIAILFSVPFNKLYLANSHNAHVMLLSLLLTTWSESLGLHFMHLLSYYKCIISSSNHLSSFPKLLRFLLIESLISVDTTFPFSGK